MAVSRLVLLPNAIELGLRPDKQAVADDSGRGHGHLVEAVHVVYLECRSGRDDVGVALFA